MSVRLATIPYRPSTPHRRQCDPTKARKAAAMRAWPTDGEAALWYLLADKRVAGVRFRRQAVLFGYIVDFFAPSIGLAVEVDGGSHRDRWAYDAARDEHLARHGISTLRVSNRDATSDHRKVERQIEALARHLRGMR